MTTDRQETIAERQSRSFGEIIRRKRRELGLNQRDLALAAGTGERFIVDLEAGKPTSQLGKSLAVAKALGLDGRCPTQSSGAGR